MTAPAASRTRRRDVVPSAPERVQETGRSLLYDLVAVGMWAYITASFEVRVLGHDRLRFERGRILASTHRRDNDVPVICGSLYMASRLWLHRRLPRPAFAVRDDLFEPGFIGGYMGFLPMPLRRVLFPVSVGPVLRNLLSCYPIRSARKIRLVQLLRERPDAPLEAIVPQPLLERLLERAAQQGRRAPRMGSDVLGPEYGDLLWKVLDQEDVPAALELEGVWERRASDAKEDFVGLVDLLVAGGMLLIFPEGRPSPDGAIGPLERGLGALARRGRATAIQPLALAYDPLTRGKPRVYVSIGPAIDPPFQRVEPVVLDALRLAMPVTCGQIVAAELVRGRGRRSSPEELDRALARAVREARDEGRYVEPRLERPGTRRQLLLDALAAADEGRVDEGALQRLARERASASARKR